MPASGGKRDCSQGVGMENVGKEKHFEEEDEKLRELIYLVVLMNTSLSRYICGRCVISENIRRRERESESKRREEIEARRQPK